MKYDIDIRDNHREVLKKYVFAYPNKRDFFLIRYFTNTTKGTNERLFPVCPVSYLTQQDTAQISEN